MRSERGSVTLWMLGLSMLLLLFGGVSIDLWRGLALQRELAAVADSAVVAAASGIDEEHYRATGEVLLDTNRARWFGSAAIAAQDLAPSAWVVTTSPDGSSVTVVLSDELNLGLLGVFVDQSHPVVVRASATARPVRRP